MEKKYELTDEHRSHLNSWRDKWIANAFSTKPMDDEERQICIEAVKGMYRAAKLDPPPDQRIVFVPSPFVLRFAGGFAAAIWYLRNRAATRNATRAATEDATGDATRAATEDATGDATWDAAGAATRAATKAVTEDATWAATRNATRAATEAATEAVTGDAAGNATKAATWAATEDATRAATWA